MLFRRVWLIAWTLLLLLCIIALWDVSEETCQQHIPILLSRALTTDPWRGLILVFNLLAVGSSFYFNSIVIVSGFLGFLCAFLVSMFQTSAHNALIFVSACCIGRFLLWVALLLVTFLLLLLLFLRSFVSPLLVVCLSVCFGCFILWGISV